MKINAKLTKKGNKHNTESVKASASSLKIFNKIDKSLAKLIKKKREDTIPSIRN